MMRSARVIFHVRSAKSKGRGRFVRFAACGFAASLPEGGAKPQAAEPRRVTV